MSDLAADKDKYGVRRQGREAALQIIYLADLTQLEARSAPEPLWSEERLPSRAKSFAKHLAEGVESNVSELDAKIQKYAENWEMRRMATIDRCLLRLAAYELLFDTDIPVSVVINEALEIAKKYSTSESSKFLNGILDKLKQERRLNP